MNIAILHYHLNRGGVTQVVLNQLKALDAAARGKTRLRIAIVFGGRREGIADEQLAGFDALDVSLHSLPALDYDGDLPPDPSSLADNIRDVLSRQGFASNDTVLHVHNHALGKNVSLPGAISQLAQQGFRFLLQLHDFAEDLRPANYRRLSDALADGGDPAPAMYPQAPQIHYAVLNGRDYRILGTADAAANNLHQLPNAVGDFGTMPSKNSARERLEQQFDVTRQMRYIVYPVRGIRRKNIGEVLLWSAACGSQTIFAVTLGPINPVERQAYNRWKQLASDLNLPCVFEAGDAGGLEFKENLSAADAIMTTSVAEGFGMVFLETWLAERQLIGRDLPEITADFIASGISFSNLYPQLRVPIEWAGREELRDSLKDVYSRLLDDYGRSLPGSEIAERVKSLLDGNDIDFAVLSSKLQSRVIRRVHEDPAARERLLDLNAAMRLSLVGADDDVAIAHNADVVRATYSLAGCGERLLQLYLTILQSAVAADVQSLPGAAGILSRFLDISRLHPIRFET